MKYCPYCERMVKPKKKINWLVFLILFFVFGLGILYLLYCVLLKKPECPICGATQLWNSPEGNKKGLNDMARDAMKHAAKKGIDKITHK